MSEKQENPESPATGDGKARKSPKKPVKKRKVPKYDPALPEKVIELGRRGYCFEQITFELNYRQDAFRQYAKEHPEFKAALEEADKTAKQMLADRRANAKHAGGRPTDYRPEYCEQVILMGKGILDEDETSPTFGMYLNGGATKAQMARELDVAVSTLQLWAEKHEEFSAALSRATDLAQAWWEDKAKNGIDVQGFNGGLWKVIMSARFPKDYREPAKVELTGKDGVPLMPEKTVVEVAPEAVAACVDAISKKFL